MVLLFVTCWTRLYGMVSLEVFGHLRFALDDAEPMFQRLLAEIARALGLDVPPGPRPVAGETPSATGTAGAAVTPASGPTAGVPR